MGWGRRKDEWEGENEESRVRGGGGGGARKVGIRGDREGTEGLETGNNCCLRIRGMETAAGVSRAVTGREGAPLQGDQIT